jgi:hypothetical protein
MLCNYVINTLQKFNLIFNVKILIDLKKKTNKHLRLTIKCSNCFMKIELELSRPEIHYRTKVKQLQKRNGKKSIFYI